MPAKTFYVFLFAIPFLPLNAQYLLRGQLPLLTDASLFIRQTSPICPAGQTSCVNDGDNGNGCCSIGVSCAFTRGTPICLEPCLPQFATCTSDLNGLCCMPGYTCNYQSSLCISTGIGNSPPTTTSESSPTPITSTAVLPPRTSTTSKPTTRSTSSITSMSSKTTSKSSITTTTSSETNRKSSANTTTSTTISTTASTATGILVATVSGQDKLELSLRMLLVGCGLAFLLG